MRGWFIARLVRGDNSSGEQRDRSTNAAAERTHARNIEVEVGNKAKPARNVEIVWLVVSLVPRSRLM